MNGLMAGFARVNITPAMGTPIAGSYKVRLAERVLDELEANVLALALGETRMLLISVDNLGLSQRSQDPLRQQIASRTGVGAEAIFIACTHTHTAPMVDGNVNPMLQDAYFNFLSTRLADAADFALHDLKPARMGWAEGRAPGIAFIRRYLMKDGSIRTNPGVNHPDVVGPVGQVDERVGVLRFDREGGETIVLAHFGVHPDTIGGCNISADWPGFARRTVERAIEGTRCIVLNGAQGDINHVNTSPVGGDLNDMTVDFDDVMRGYGHARHMGRTIAGAVLQVYGKVCYTPVDSLQAAQKVIRHPSNRPRPEDLPMARLYDQLHKEHRDSEIPYQGMMLTTIVAEAERMLQLENGPDEFALRVSVAVIGNVALVGVPGEPFSGVGRAIKAAPGWAMVLPCCCVNGNEAYFPDMEAYQNGSYEVRSSIFKAGVGEAISGEALRMLDAIRKTGGQTHVE